MIHYYFYMLSFWIFLFSGKIELKMDSPESSIVHKRIVFLSNNECLEDKPIASLCNTEETLIKVVFRSGHPYSVHCATFVKKDEKD